MTFGKYTILAGALLALAPGSAAAMDTILSGVFDGSENATAPLPGSCGGSNPLKYQAIASVQVSSSGTYFVKDAFNFGSGDVTALIYDGAFNPGNPNARLITPDGIDFSDEVALQTGKNYTVVVQHWCENREAAWAVTFTGPGTVNTPSAVEIPDFTSGSFTGQEPTVSTACGDASYQQFGPVQVSRDGTYFFVDILEDRAYGFADPDALDICLHVYDAPPNPASPGNNLVDTLDISGTVELEANQNYYFLVQPWESNRAGDYFFVFAPPAPFRITHAMAGGWYNTQTAGQGLLIDIFDNSDGMFVAWFTFDLERPDPGVAAMIGDPGHRWMTAQGPFSGDTAQMPITWTTGMIFDSANPGFSQEQDGTLTVQFFDCVSGQATYDLGTAGVADQFPIVRLSNDARDLCESLLAGPGQPGPL